jgi:predicted CXXCH cytochrome family protein
MAVALLLSWPAYADLEGSKHDMSVRGGGPVRAGSETERCIFCHAPHNAAPGKALWNKDARERVYELYSSSSLQAVTGQPTGSSKHCLSCHDGTIALGRIRNRAVPIHLTGQLSSSADLTTDLSDDHPISFVYDSSLAMDDQELVDPTMLPPTVILELGNQLQCTTCHDPHLDTYPKFLVMDNEYSSLCLVCHEKGGWTPSAHATSTATWGGGGIDPWPHTAGTNVAKNGCENCHRPHAAGHSESLLNFPLEEDNCLSCHAGSVASTDILSDMQKTYSHPVDEFEGVHDPVEDFDTMPRHVECHDCHNPHAATSRTAQPPYAGGPLDRVAGITSTGERIDAVRYQYELCYRCHANDWNTPVAAIGRQVSEYNLRKEFDPSNPSFHPVVAPGRNPDVPSLLFPVTESSTIYCTDCHGSDSGPGVSGSATSGPHGSIWRFLLEREYRVTDFEHGKHIEEEESPCSVCHDPHGVSPGVGGQGSHSHLINFDLDVVQPDTVTGLLQFEDLGSHTGLCYLECHGVSHSPEEY